jgi:hypothetical protein
VVVVRVTHHIVSMTTKHLKTFLQVTAGGL